MLTNYGTSLSGSPTIGFLGLSTTTPSVGQTSNWNFSEPIAEDYSRIFLDDISDWSITAISTFNQSANSWGTITYVGLWDSEANGNLLGFLQLTLVLNIPIVSIIYFNANSLDFSDTTTTGYVYSSTLPFIFQGGTVNKQRESWALAQARRFASDALMWYGEQCIVRLLWRPEDYAAGYCERCLTDNASPNPTDPDENQSILSQAAHGYKQSGNWFCPVCNGTGFTGPNQSGGGFKPIIYQTFMIAEDTVEKRKRETTFRFWQENPHVTIYPVPAIKDGDLVIRVEKWDKTNRIPLATGERFQATAVVPQTIRSGPDNSITQGQQNFNQTWPILVSQSTVLKNLPVTHPFYQVEAYNEDIETINVQRTPNYTPVL